MLDKAMLVKEIDSVESMIAEANGRTKERQKDRVEEVTEEE